MDSEAPFGKLAFGSVLLPCWPILQFADLNKNETGMDVGWLCWIAGGFVLTILVISTAARIVAGTRAGLRTALTLAVFFTALHFYFDFKTMFPGRNDVLIVILAFSALAGIALGAWFASRSQMVVTLVGLFTLTVVAFAGVSLLFDPGKLRWTSIGSVGEVSDNQPSVRPATEIGENIYVFVFDAYMRSDMLKKYYKFNNDDFVTKMQNRGFILAKNSYSNFPTTRYSLNLMLNPALANLPTSQLRLAIDKNESFIAQEKSELQRWAAEFGYAYVFMRYNGGIGSACGPHCIGVEPRINLMQVQYFKTLPAYELVSMFFPGLREGWLSGVANDARHAISQEPAKEPFLLFAHVLLPHPPYARHSDCSLRLGAEFKYEEEQARQPQYDRIRQLYLDQVSCANRQMIEIADDLEKRDPDAIVVFTSDHGWKAIFSAIATNSEDALRIRHSNLWIARLPPPCRHLVDDNIVLSDTFPLITGCIERRPPELLPKRIFAIADGNQIEEISSKVRNWK